MRKESNKNSLNGFSTMKPRTRTFILSNFIRENGTVDTQRAAEFFCVTTRTINNWWSTGCPDWVNRYVELYQRSIPESKEWQGFSFSPDGKLLTPYKNLTFTSGQLLNVFFDRQFNRLDRAEKEKLSAQVDSLRNDDEAAAIRDELEVIINTLTKLKQSPIVAPKKAFAKTAKRTVKRSE